MRHRAKRLFLGLPLARAVRLSYQRTYESFIEIEFWLKVLLSLMDEQEIYEKTLELCKKTEEIIKSMEDEL